MAGCDPNWTALSSNACSTAHSAKSFQSIVMVGHLIYLGKVTTFPVLSPSVRPVGRRIIMRLLRLGTILEDVTKVKLDYAAQSKSGHNARIGSSNTGNHQHLDVLIL
jgi:hypothetical protein